MSDQDESKFERRVRRVVEPILDEEIVRFSQNLLASPPSTPASKDPLQNVRTVIGAIDAFETRVSNVINEMKDEVRRIELAVTDPSQQEKDDEDAANPETSDPTKDRAWDALDRFLDALPDSQERERIREFILKSKEYSQIGRLLQLGTAGINLVSKTIEAFTTYNKVIEYGEDILMGQSNLQINMDKIHQSLANQSYLQNLNLKDYLHDSFGGVLAGLQGISEGIATCCSGLKRLMKDYYEDLKLDIGHITPSNLFDTMQKMMHLENARGGL